VRCIYVVIGQKASALVGLVETLQRHDALTNTCIVAATADAPAGMRYLAPYAGCTIAEYFRDKGEDALVVFDDLSRHAIAYRELSLLLRRPPGREAYPGDIFFVHSRLLERATQLDADNGGGSLTALPIAETQAGRISDFIPTNLISITDGQLYLDRLRFERGIKPAIDVGLSVSRVGGKAQRASLKAVSGKLRLDLARFGEVEVFSRFGTRLEESTRALLRRGERAREVLKQKPSSALAVGEQVVLLTALDEGAFDEIPVADVGRVANRFLASARREMPDLLRSLSLGRLPSDEQLEDLRQLFGQEVSSDR
jgi:F-type H+-transporting ATPase subunit alpha